ncbi:hypothetical protein LTR17_025779 [Elasticomyces elasticus]|nr:hypothetical protein LTR17_025779 [Elasticomyces elasticus]
MIDFFYKHTYDKELLGLTHVAVYTIADKYNIQDLMALAADHFLPQAESNWGTETFCNHLTQIYDHGPEKSMLKHSIVRVTADHFVELYGDRTDKYNKFRETALGLPEFAIEWREEIPLRVLQKYEYLQDAAE